MTDTTNKDTNPLDSPDSLVDALESIKHLLVKGDSKLAAARESIAKASTPTVLDKLDINDHIQHVIEEQPGQDEQHHQPLQHLQHFQPEQFEIPVLNDIVIPAADDDSDEETLATAAENIPTLYDSIENPSPKIMLNYIDKLQETLEKSLSESLKQSVLSIEVKLKQSLATEIDNLREQVKKDFS